MSAVMAYNEWPRCSWTTLVCVPAASRKLATECRRVCRVTPRRPARSARTSKRRSTLRGLERCPDLGGEDQPVLLPGSGGRAVLLQLPGSVGPERLDRRAGEWHGSAGLVGLG